jgi:hypothetical protein
MTSQAQQINYKKLLFHLPSFDARTLALELALAFPEALVDLVSVRKQASGLCVDLSLSSGVAISYNLTGGLPLACPSYFG